MKMINLKGVEIEIPLPVIVYCAEKFVLENYEKEYNEYYVESSYYQTSKISCLPFYKPMYIKKRKDDRETI